MRASFLFGSAVGYVLGTRAGRKRYEDLVAITRRVAGSPIVQSATGAATSRASQLASRASHRVAARIPGVRTISIHRLATADGSLNGGRSNGGRSKGWTNQH
ncbi:MAG: secreted protein [Frankiales bacterium]|nr:secreted protein [Frankiales bacterium]